MIRYDFSNRAAVVTGAGGGMGEATALALSEAGCAVTAIDLKPMPVSLARRERLHFVQGDLTDYAFVEAAMADAHTQWGRLDYLANIAGVLWFGRDKSLFEMDLGVWDRVMAINLKSMVHTARAAAPFMKRNGAGAMVHVSTIQWLRGDAVPQDAYQASKAAVCALSKSIAMQLAADGIRSNAILPGPALTPLQDRWDTEAKRQAVADYIPLKRLGTAEDMANAILFLLSDEAGFITGIELPIDGGLLMRM